MKLECVINQMRYISEAGECYRNERMKALDLPIHKNHVNLFNNLPMDGNAKPFHDVMKDLKLSKSSLSDMVTKYEKQGLMNRSSCIMDKRAIYISLTKEGIMIRERLDQIEREVITALLEGYSDTEIEDLKKHISHMMDNARDRCI